MLVILSSGGGGGLHGSTAAFRSRPGSTIWLRKIRNNDNITYTPFEHYYLIIAFHIRDRILTDKMTPVSFPITMNYTLDVSIHDVKRLIDVK